MLFANGPTPKDGGVYHRLYYTPVLKTTVGPSLGSLYQSAPTVNRASGRRGRWLPLGICFSAPAPLAPWHRAFALPRATLPSPGVPRVAKPMVVAPFPRYDSQGTPGLCFVEQHSTVLLQ